jgi:pimeloyl-ACP methyl ester carboxylesterase
MPPEITHRRVRVGDIRLHVTEAGDGPPVVLLHGFPELAHSWRHQVPALAAAGYRAVAPDLRGYGRSDRPAQVEDYGIAALAGDVAGLVAELGGSAHLVAHDWGGSLAWVLASRAPDTVRSLTILNSPHPVASAEARRESDAQRAKSWYMLLFQFPGVAETWLSADDFANLRAFVFDTAAPGTFSDEDRERFLSALRQDGALTAALNYYRANMPPAAWVREPPQLPPVTAPTMIVWGMADAYLGEELLERSVAKCAGEVRVERLPGVSHWIQQEAPGEVNRLLRDWLGQREPAGAA